MSQPLLEGREMGRQSRDGAWLLRHVSLEVAAGERWAVAGPTGSGKTLLLRSLALLDGLDEGEVLWKQESIADGAVPEFRRHVIYLHQRPVLVEGTVRDNLAVADEFGNHKRENGQAEDVASWLRSLDRDEGFLDKQSGDLSGGEGQIVALLRAMRLQPSILLLDEPTAALDAKSVESIEALVDAWQKETGTSRATVWVTHDAKQIDRVAERTIRLREGRMEESP